MEETDTKTLEFKGIGKFTIKGLTVGEDMRTRDAVRQRKGIIDENEVALELLQLALTDSPQGIKPPLIFLKALPLGVGIRLLKEMGDLSSVDIVESKNLETQSEETKK